MSNITETINAVNSIECDIYDLTKNDDVLWVDIVIAGNHHAVKFADIMIWNDEDDMRKYDDELHVYEPLEQYLRNQINDIVSIIGKIKL